MWPLEASFKRSLCKFSNSKKVRPIVQLNLLFSI